MRKLVVWLTMALVAGLFSPVQAKTAYQPDEGVQAEARQGFEQILDLPDPELFAYLTGRSAPEDPAIARLVDRIRSSHRPQA